MNRIEAVIGGMKMVRKLTFEEAVAVGEHRATKRIRKAIASALKELKAQARQTVCACRLRRLIGEAPPCPTCKTRAALLAIDAATRAPKRGPKR